MKRVVALLPVLIAFQAGAPPALAWTWPADGPVLRPFALGDDPYAAAQHRGVDIASPSGGPVRAPASGVVSFAGTVPGGGRTVTIQTADGYSVTLVHLGAIAVERGQELAEGAGVGSVGPSGDSEHAEPYVHLGVRVTADPTGYVDPLGLLPAREAPPPPSPAPPAEQVPEAPLDSPPSPETPGVPSPAPHEPAPAPEPELPARAPAAAAPPVPAPTAENPAVPAASGVRAQAAETRPKIGRARTRIERSLERGFGLAASGLSTARNRGHGALAASSTDMKPGRSSSVLAGGLTALGSAALGVLVLARRRRDLGRARGADTAPSVLGDGARRAAEDASVPRTAEENGLVANGDLERVALGEPESLPDLDRDHDPAELVQVPDDPGCRPPATASSRRFHQVVSRPPRHRRRAARPAARAIP
jgi:peptidase M23-like protein